jgi:hypothetical protein
MMERVVKYGVMLSAAKHLDCSQEGDVEILRFAQDDTVWTIGLFAEESAAS